MAEHGLSPLVTMREEAELRIAYDRMMVLLGRLHAYVPYGSQLWRDVAKARGLEPKTAPRTTGPGATYPMIDAEIAQ